MSLGILSVCTLVLNWATLLMSLSRDGWILNFHSHSVIAPNISLFPGRDECWDFLAATRAASYRVRPRPFSRRGRIHADLVELQFRFLVITMIGVSAQRPNPNNEQNTVPAGSGETEESYKNTNLKEAFL